jgi:hypothetical protein
MPGSGGAFWRRRTTEAGDIGRRLQRRIDRSESADVLSFLTFASGADVELDGLAFRKGLHALTLNIRDVDEHVIAVLTRDEAEAPVRVEEFHCASPKRLRARAQLALDIMKRPDG